MKTYLFILITGLFSISLFSCSEASYMLYTEIDRVQMVQEDINYNFIYAEDLDAVRDTVYITVMTIGYPREYDRKIDFQQITEYTEEIVTDEKGNIIDTLYHEVLNKAVSGVHYVPMDDPEITPHLVIKANQVKAEIPIIVLKAEDLKEEERRLCLELIATDAFALGEQTKLSQTIYIANNYSKPSGWTEWYTTYRLGKYSQVKHEFMTRTLGLDIDDAWFSSIGTDPGLGQMYVDRLKAALKAWNEDPVNKDKAPMKDEDKEQVVFP